MQFDSGRTRQKMRTRRELLAAARRLLERGETISIDAVAVEADISRTTAYRYFSDAEALVVEAILDGQTIPHDEIVGDSEDVRERVRKVHRYLLDLVLNAESAYRTYLASSLTSSLRHGAQGLYSHRGGRRIAMYEHALAPVRQAMAQQEFAFLVYSLSAVSGIESLVALKDVCRLDDELVGRVAGSVVDAILDRHLGPLR
ncbi:TetR/AcrR family transcriptional regulator [Kaistia granuli]|jgi:AcrR family transcriptional regulator|uniref:TetR/AcrR family transcriptional regulator n=1 Tax=Kaistia granuli TaxID=363259 RepID=UPI000368E087|nr:TetR/AcrR family transcriptional regulator [Kaistia granuli]